MRIATSSGRTVAVHLRVFINGLDVRTILRLDLVRRLLRGGDANKLIEVLRMTLLWARSSGRCRSRGRSRTSRWALSPSCRAFGPTCCARWSSGGLGRLISATS